MLSKGVTLLAFGNAAPHVLSAITSITSLDNGIQLALGDLFGSDFFMN